MSDTNEQRLIQLTNRIETFNRQMALDLGDEFLNMYEVTWVGQKRMALETFDGGEIFEQVMIPEGLAGFLKAGDVFLMKLAPTETGWMVSFMSPPYEEEEWDYGPLH